MANSRLRQRPATAFFLFSSTHCAATLFLSCDHSQKCSKCAFAYIIIIIQSRAAFNPCCLFYTKKIVFFAQKAELFVNMCRFSPQKSRRTALCAAALYRRDDFEWLRMCFGYFQRKFISTLPRVKMLLERSILLTGSRNSAPEPAAACAQGKRRNRHTGRACCGSPAARGTTRWAPVPAVPDPAGKAQSPYRRAEWGT